MFLQIILCLLLFAAPALIIASCQRISLLNKLGVVVCAFILGIIIASSVDFSSLNLAADIRGAQSTVSELSIALALPLLLFSIDVKSSIKIAGKTLKALLIAFSSIVFISIIGAIIFHSSLDNISDLSGMLVGAYTGGGPNMVSVKAAINADEQLFLTMVTYDIVFSTFYLLFIITIGKTLFRRFLLPYIHKPVKHEQGAHQAQSDMTEMSDESPNSYNRLLAFDRLKHTSLAFACSIFSVVIALSLTRLLPESAQGNGTIIILTTLGLCLSFVKRVRNLQNGFRLGMYLILVFCFTSGTMINQEVLSNINTFLAAYISFVLIGSLIIQVAVSRLFKIDADTSIVASSAAILSVPLIPIISSALNNKEVLIPGYAAGIMGYAVGNYLGIFVANFTNWLL